MNNEHTSHTHSFWNELTLEKLISTSVGHAILAAILTVGATIKYGFSAPVPLWAALVLLLVGVLLSLVVVGIRDWWISRRVLPRRKHLSQMAQFYPIKVTKAGDVQPDPVKFKEALHYFSRGKVTDESLDFYHLSLTQAPEEWGISDAVEIEKHLIFQKRHTKYVRKDLEELKRQLFEQYARLVEGIGATIGSKHVEIVLHDIRNPFHSIRAIANPITQRQLKGKITDFGTKLTKAFDGGQLKGNELNYQITGRNIKGSTIPLWTQELGLFGFICINVDLEKLKAEELIDSMTWIDPANKVREVIK